MKTNMKNSLLSGMAVAVFLTVSAATSPGASANGDGAWQPAASERLVRLPANQLKKAIDRDFSASPLASAIRDRSDGVAAKKQTLAELQDAIELAEGDLRIELKHQFLAEKQAFIRLLGERMEFQQKESGTRVRLYRRLLDKIQRGKRGRDAQTTQLVDLQQQARQRFDSAIGDVDLNVFGTGADQSKYAVAYARNRTAIDRLVAAVNAHPMNQMPEFDGEPMAREDFIRRLIQDAEAKVAILDQEKEILGYMGKLVALDAMALSEEVAELETGGEFATENASVSIPSVTDFFIQ